MTPPSFVRPARHDDLAGVAEVLRANGEPLEWLVGPGVQYLEHMLERGDMWVTTGERAGVITGYSASITLGDARMLADLFVDPAHHAAGLGSALLQAALSDRYPRMTNSSADPRAMSLYVRAGMRPLWPAFYLEAPAGASDHLPLDSRLTTHPSTVEETAALSLAITGIDRREDYCHYESLPGSSGFVVERDGRPIAVGWGRPGSTTGRTLHHAVIAPDADPVAAALAVIRTVTPDGEPFSGSVPGPHPALPILLDAGYRISDRDTYCASEPGWLDPERILPNPALL